MLQRYCRHVQFFVALAFQVVRYEVICPDCKTNMVATRIPYLAFYDPLLERASWIFVWQDMSTSFVCNILLSS
jgi:hypothetical protein